MSRRTNDPTRASRVQSADRKREPEDTQLVAIHQHAPCPLPSHSRVISWALQLIAPALSVERCISAGGRSV